MIGYDGGGIRVNEIVGFGTSRLAAKILKNSLTDAILKCGVRSIDTAKVYGNEHIIGDVIDSIINSNIASNRDLKSDIENNEESDYLSLENKISATVSNSSGTNKHSFKLFPNTYNNNDDEDRPLKREDFFITSKVWNDDHRAEHVRQSCLKSLKDLKIDYLDLYLVHWYVSHLKFILLFYVIFKLDI